MEDDADKWIKMMATQLADLAKRTCGCKRKHYQAKVAAYYEEWRKLKGKAVEPAAGAAVE